MDSNPSWQSTVIGLAFVALVAPAQRAGQPQPVGQLDQQPDTGMADDAVGVGANLNR